MCSPYYATIDQQKAKQNKENAKRWGNEGTDTGLRLMPYEAGPHLIAPALHTPPGQEEVGIHEENQGGRGSRK
jgi:hypothetical protein